MTASPSSTLARLATSRLLLVTALLALTVIIGAIYWAGIGGGFTFDDYPNIVNNPSLRIADPSWARWMEAIFSSNAGEFKRPLVMLTFVVQIYLTGMNPEPMKIVNIGIHAANALLAYGVLAALLRSARSGTPLTQRWAAVLGAAVWALLPINMLPTLFVVQRMEILAHTFVLAGLWAYLVARWRNRQGLCGFTPALAAVSVFTILALLCKESGALLPLYAALAEASLFGFRDRDGNHQRSVVVAFLIILVVPGLLGGAWQLRHALQPGSYASRDFTLIERLLTEPRALVDYLSWTVFPDVSRMGLYHDDYVISHGLLSPPSTLAAITFLAFVAGAAWWLRARRPLASLGIAWFFAGHSMTASFIPLELVFEHRNYFPSLGIVIVALDLILFASSRESLRRVGWITLTLAGIGYGALTHIRALEWSDPVRFAMTESAKSPLSPRATYQLGQTLGLLSGGDPRSAFAPMAINAMERARLVPNGNILPAQGLLIFSSRIKRPLKDEWWDEIVDRLGKRPVGAQERGAIQALTTCAVDGSCQFPADRMVQVYVAALSRSYHPDLLNAYANYALNRLHDSRLAIGLLSECVRLSPREPQYRANLALSLAVAGRYDEARAQIAILRGMSPHTKATRLADMMEQHLSRLAAPRP